MKKRLICFSILSTIFGILGLFLAFVMTTQTYSYKLLGGTPFEFLYNFVYSSGFQDFMKLGNLGPVFYIALLAVIIITILNVTCLRVPPVDDSTVPPVNVKQTSYAIDYSKDALVPSMVVVNEQLDEGEGE